MGPAGCVGQVFRLVVIFCFLFLLISESRVLRYPPVTLRLFISPSSSSSFRIISFEILSLGAYVLRMICLRGESTLYHSAVSLLSLLITFALKSFILILSPQPPLISICIVLMYFFTFFFLKKTLLFLSLAVMSLHRCTWAVSVAASGATLRRGVWASHWGGFCCGAWVLGAWASVAAAPELECWLSRRGAWA